MKPGVTVGLIGTVLLIAGGLWYWRLLEMTAAFAGLGVAVNLESTTTRALIMAGAGLGLILLGAVLSLFSQDDST